MEHNDHSDELPSTLLVESPDLVEGHDEDEEAMPGFHEHDENDADLDQEDGEEAPADLEPNVDAPVIDRPKPRPPVSAPARSTSTTVMPPSIIGTSASTVSAPGTSTKSHSTSHVTRQPEPSTTSRIDIGPPKKSGKRTDAQIKDDVAAGRVHTCPICGKAFETDNQGLNEHVDFCLSRGAIREAQAEARSPAKRESGWQWEKRGEDGGRKAIEKPRSTVTLKGKGKKG